ncbi:unnamed protein product [Prorocentrum cordatum]|uniref:Uncharacterized protein n=1 Tax=Prorocentrum cordatum TaxID=2364126 RepID=A0ABN9XSE2_9DINO|nr:unnamed protein product [Polarella glacialis]
MNGDGLYRGTLHSGSAAAKKEVQEDRGGKRRRRRKEEEAEDLSSPRRRLGHTQEDHLVHGQEDEAPEGPHSLSRRKRQPKTYAKFLRVMWQPKTWPHLKYCLDDAMCEFKLEKALAAERCAHIT